MVESESLCLCQRRSVSVSDNSLFMCQIETVCGCVKDGLWLCQRRSVAVSGTVCGCVRVRQSVSVSETVCGCIRDGLWLCQRRSVAVSGTVCSCVRVRQSVSVSETVCGCVNTDHTRAYGLLLLSDYCREFFALLFPCPSAEIVEAMVFLPTGLPCRRHGTTCN